MVLQIGIIEPTVGMLACKDVGKGKLPDPEVLLDYIAMELAREKTLAGVRVTVTAGPTQESLDPVRYLTNHSSGRMGYAIARATGDDGEGYAGGGAGDIAGDRHSDQGGRSCRLPACDSGGSEDQKARRRHEYSAGAHR